ncbi:MAG: hypothetical protein WBD86_00460 [Microgenomates group bacterium]
MERSTRTYYRNRAKEVVLAASEAYFKKSGARSLSPFERFSHTVEVEEVHRSAQLMGVPENEIIQTHMSTMPPEVRQDYFSTIARKCNLELKYLISLTQEFGLKLE